MRASRLRTVVAVRLALLVLAVVLLISAASNLLINRQFEKYVGEQQAAQAEELAGNLADQYDPAIGGWNLDYVHGMGMYALREGYLIRLYDAQGTVLWDAEHHDMTLCRQMMDTVTLRMQQNRPAVAGDFVTHRFELAHRGAAVGAVDIRYYGPYSFRENDFQFIAALNRILAVVGAVSLLGAAAAGRLLAGDITRPIEKTVEITRQISEGDYSIRFRGAVRAAELQELARAVNQMAEALEEQETLRRRLTSDVAHELRTPLANVSAYLEASQEGVWEPTAERLQRCYEELQRLSKLVEDLERLRQVENERLTLHKTEVNLLELAKAVEKDFELPLAQGRLCCTVEGTDAVIRADRDKLQQVMTNLLSNAVKYSNEGGKIRLTVEDKGTEAVFSVEDTGIGIAESDKKRVFERFYRTDRSRSRQTGGAGIGLTIVKAIVQAHGGTVGVESTEGQGSCFTVTLPKQG